jgi:hypothetical protein
VKQLDHNSTIDWFAASAVVARPADVHRPPWSTPLLVIGIAVVACAGIAVFLELDERLRRWIYWSTFMVGSLLMAASVSFRGWRGSAIMFLGAILIAFFITFFRDYSLIKIGHQKISYMLPREQRATGDARQAIAPPADSYLGLVSANNHWWLIAVGNCCFAGGLYLIGWTWALSLSAVAVVVAAFLSGWDDAARGFPIARRQRVQFAIASIASLAMFALPMLAYLGAYFGVKKWLTDDSKHCPGEDPGDGLESE